MKKWKVTFRRSNSSVGSDIFTAESKWQAIKAFNACYRHDVYEIVSVELVET